MTMKLCFLSYILCLIIETRAKPSRAVLHPRSNQDDMLAGLKQTLRGLDKLVLFFEGHVSKINLDGIYGLRVTEGALNDSLTEHSEAFWNGIPEAEGQNIRKQLVELIHRTGSVSNHAQYWIKKQDLSYFNTFKAVVDKPWHFFAKFGTHKLPQLQATSDNGEEENEWNEKTSDQCMSEALGSNDKHVKCLFSDKCIVGITDGRQVGYGLTHHVLFLTISLINKCEKNYSAILLQRNGVDVSGLIHQRCSAIMAEMVALEKKGVPEDQEDLYLEQGFVCGIHGIEEFLSLDRVRDVLSRQRSFGCFGNITDEDMDEEGHRRSSRDNRGLRGNPESYRSMRRLLVDVTLEHGCSSHESGVAAGYLGLYTKWLLTKLDPSSLAPTEPTNIPITNTELQLSVSTQGIKLQRTAPFVREIKDNKMYSPQLVVLVSFLTTILTLVMIYVLYKCKLYCCSDLNGNHEYKKVNNRPDIM